MKTEEQIKSKIRLLNEKLKSITDDIEKMDSNDHNKDYLIDKAYEIQSGIDELEWVLN